MVCLFGDAVADEFGYARLGFSAWAGLALALADAPRPVGLEA